MCHPSLPSGTTRAGTCFVTTSRSPLPSLSRAAAPSLQPVGTAPFDPNLFICRKRSVREVRNFLRSLGASLEGGACVIRQVGAA